MKSVSVALVVLICIESAIAQIKCENSTDIKYEWEWCNTNTITHTNNKVTKVCYGRVTYTDMIFEAVQLSFMSTANQECLFASGRWLELNEPDCKGAVSVFSSIYGEPSHTLVKACRENGETVRVDGISTTTLDVFSVSR